jgi:muconolactone D-isomerase
VDFLVEIEVRLPGEWPDERRSALLREELARGVELRRAGVIQRIWRIPGALRNVGVWSAADATELHEQLASLPAFRFATVSVTPLAVHPVESSA